MNRLVVVPAFITSFVVAALTGACDPVDPSPEEASADAAPPVEQEPEYDAAPPVEPEDDAAPPIDEPDVDAGVPVEPPELRIIEPQPYLSRADSPFEPLGLAVFFLEDFEDGALNTPGATADTTQLSSTFGASRADSVDGDDGNPSDGTCAPACDALFGGGSITITFDAAALGGLPTHAGAVWTDGGGLVTFEAFDAQGASLGATTAAALGDASISGTTGEDHFLGIVSPVGIARFTISNTSGGTEIDHLQYGR